MRVYAFARAVLLASLLLVAGTSLRAAQQTATPANKTAAAPVETRSAPAPIGSGHAQKLALRGVPNFGRVTQTLYRGGQPKREGYAELRKLGIEIVVNFRDERGEIEAERRAVEALDLRYVSIPWSSRRTPASPQVAEFLELLRANPGKKVFAHCHYGKDRTGVMVATYRIAMENWTPSQAIAEMNAFHYHHFWYPHLKTYVQDFPQRLAADPHLRRLAPTNTAAP